MKKLLFGASLALGVILTSCSVETTVENKMEQESSLTCELLLSKVDSLEGKQVTISALSWGNSNVMGGGLKLNLGDTKLEGLSQASVVANFDAENIAEAEGIEKNSEVTIEATVGGVEYGSVQLNDPKIIK